MAIFKPSTPFVSTVMDPSNPSNQALWVLGQILNVSPFSDEIQKLTVPQIHWIFTMHEHFNLPKEERDKEIGLQVSESRSNWQKSLTTEAFRKMVYKEEKPAWLKALEEREKLRQTSNKAKS